VGAISLRRKFEYHKKAMPDPTLAVVIPTRNRAEHAVACVRSVLASGHFDELLVVDQSDGRETESALAGLDPRVRYVRSQLRGATNGRNTGIEMSNSEIVAFTDDDCRVAPDWTSKLIAIFAGDPAAAVVCGRVRVPQSLEDKGYTTTFEPEIREWRGRFPPPGRDWGLTANFAARRSVFAELGDFDGRLGAGTPLASGEEQDFLFRALKAGHKVVNAREAEVDHLGVRAQGAQSTQLWRQYALGTSAALFKHIRLGDLDAMGLFLGHLAGCGKLILTNVLHLHRPVGFGYAQAFVAGAFASFRFKVDRSRRRFIDR
jgi:GT2 family glycosyltransferase